MDFYDEEYILLPEREYSIYCYWHKKFHNPIEEKYLHGYIDVKTFGELREADFFRAAEALGVPKENILSNALVKQDFTQENIEKIITQYINKYPNADFKTMSKYDGHNQHALIGKTLEDLEKKNANKTLPNYLLCVNLHGSVFIY